MSHFDADLPIELLQTANNRYIKDRLEQAINTCVSLKAAVAFFSIDAKYFKKLEEVLSREESFFCVDIHSPTNLDELKNFYSNESKPKPNFFLFVGGKTNKQDVEQLCKYLEKNPRKRLNDKIPDAVDSWQLLHAKLLLFTFKDNRAEIWIGSQNFTNAAIIGEENLESTVVIKTTGDTDEYKQYLNYLRMQCVAFDPKNIECYRRIQVYLGTDKNGNRPDPPNKELKVLCEDVNDIKGEIVVFSNCELDTSTTTDGSGIKLASLIGHQKLITRKKTKTRKKQKSQLVLIAQDSKKTVVVKCVVKVAVTTEFPMQNDGFPNTTNMSGIDNLLHESNGYIIRLSHPSLGGKIYPFYFKASEDRTELFRSVMDKISSKSFIWFRLSIEDSLVCSEIEDNLFIGGKEFEQQQHTLYLNYYNERLKSIENADISDLYSYNKAIVVQRQK